MALRWSMDAVYDSHPGEVFWAASDLGWAVGHSYIVYAPLLTGCTTVLYEGKPVGTPDPGAFWRVVAEHGVKVLFTAPTAFRAIKKEDPEGSHLARPRPLAASATCSSPASGSIPTRITGRRELLGVPVVDHWWQTESGWPMAANCLGIEPLPVKPGSPSSPVPGYDVRILDESGEPLGAGRGRRGRRAPAAASRDASRPCGGRRALRRVVPERLSRATTRPATAATSTTTATCS